MRMLLVARVVVVLVGALCLGACSYGNILATNKIDPAANLSRSDYTALRHRSDQAPPPDDTAFPPIPNSALDLIPPPAPAPEGSDRLVSVSVTDSVPLRDVLVELARESKVNLELDPRIQGGIIFTAHNQPFNDVLKRICAMAGLRSTVDGNFIHIELDERWTPATQHDDLHIIAVSPDSVQLRFAPAPGMPFREIALKPYQTFQLSTGKVVEGSALPPPGNPSR